MRLMVALLMLLLAGMAVASPIEPAQVHVVDGDTVTVRGDVVNTRLVGFDAPETGARAKCPSEVELGQRATALLKEIVATGELDLERIACSCPTGTEGTRFCNYGRHCAILRSHGQDVAEIMIAEGLAHPLTCSKTRCPKLEPWC
jgi:endonuclease YncB( thermonuclease family)